MQNGNISYLASSEEEALNMVKDLLDFLPLTCNDPAPVFAAPTDEEIAYDEALNSFMPDDTNQGYDMHDLLDKLFDDANLLEIQEEYTPNLITTFARVDGKDNVAEYEALIHGL